MKNAGKMCWIFAPKKNMIFFFSCFYREHFVITVCKHRITVCKHLSSSGSLWHSDPSLRTHSIRCWRPSSSSSWVSSCRASDIPPTEKTPTTKPDKKKPNLKSKKGANIVCYVCEATGHYARDCPKREGKAVAFIADHTEDLFVALSM